MASKSNQNLMLAVIVILALALAGAGFYVYKLQSDLQKSNETIEIKDVELRKTFMKLDSIQNELTQKMAEIERLGGDADSLKAIIAKIEKEKAEFRSKNGVNAKRANELKGKISQYENLMKEKDAEIARLKSENESLRNEKGELAKAKDSLEGNVSNLRASNLNLNRKLMEASVLKAENIKLFAVNDKGKERDDENNEFKIKHLHALKIAFSIAENRAAEMGNKKIVCRVIDPDGQVIFDESKGSGSFNFEGKEVFYSIGTEIMYENKSKSMELRYVKAADFKKGKHKVEIFGDGQFIGEASFMAK